MLTVDGSTMGELQKYTDDDRKIDNSVLVQIGDVEILFRKVEEVIPVVLNKMNTIATGEDNVFQIVLPNKMDTDIIVINASHKRVVLLDTWKVATSNMLNIIELQAAELEDR